MKRCLIIAIFFFCTAMTMHAQGKYDIIQLKGVNKMQGIHRVALPFHELVFARPASVVIADYIQRSIDHLPRADQSLYFDLRQLRYGNAANQASVTDTNTYQTESLRTNAIEDWAHYPINTQQPSSNGIYLTFDDFLQSKMQKVNYSLRMALDSNYLMDLGNLESIPRDSLARLRKPWGLFFNGMFYIGMDDPHTRNSTSRFFLPLVKSNNTYHFHLPHDLPNMYAILSIGVTGTRDVLDDSGSNSPSLAIGLVSIAANVAYNAHQNKLIRNKQRNIMTNGLSQDMRDCFVDMDSGDIVY